MERWAKIKDKFVNMAIAPYVEVRKVEKEFSTYGGIDCSKGKNWVVFAGHHACAATQKKPEAEKIARDLVEGAYDLK